MTETPETRHHVSPHEPGAEVVIWDGHPLFQMDLVRIIPKGRGGHGVPTYLHTDLGDDGHTVTLEWRDAAAAGTETNPLDQDFPGYLVPASWLPALRDAITRHLGEGQHLAQLREDLVTVEDERDRLATEVLDMRGERDVARAEAVGAERTLEAVQNHLEAVVKYAQHLEALAYPRKWATGPQKGVNIALENMDAATAGHMVTIPHGVQVGTFGPDHPADHWDTAMDWMVGRYGITNMVEWLEATDWWKVERAPAPGPSSTPVEKPVENGSGDQPTDGETWTTVYGDTWTHRGDSDDRGRYWVLTASMADPDRVDAIYYLDPREAITPEALLEAAQDYAAAKRED